MTTRAPSLDQLDRVLGVISAVPLALIVALTFSDVFARYLFSRPIAGASEVIQFSMAVAIFTALPLVTRAGGHITVDLLVSALSERRRTYLQLPCELLSGLALALLAWRLSVQANEYSQNDTVTIVLGLDMAPLAYVMAIFAGISVVVVGLRLTLALRTARLLPEGMQ